MRSCLFLVCRTSRAATVRSKLISTHPEASICSILVVRLSILWLHGHSHWAIWLHILKVPWKASMMPMPWASSASICVHASEPCAHLSSQCSQGAGCHAGCPWGLSQTLREPPPQAHTPVTPAWGAPAGDVPAWLTHRAQHKHRGQA